MQGVQGVAGHTIFECSWLRRIGTGQGSFKQPRLAQLLTIVERAFLVGTGKKLLEPAFQGFIDMQRRGITFEDLPEQLIVSTVQLIAGGAGHIPEHDH